MLGERSAQLKIGGKIYTLVLTLKATKAISARFGGLSKLGENLADANVDQFDTIIWLIALLANQSVLIHNFESGDKMPEITTEEIELLMTPADLRDAKDSIMEALTKGVKREIESEENSKN